jgi:cell division control protein 12
MRQEQQPKRQDKIDLRVHACLYFIRPTGHTLRPLDIEVMKRLGSRVNLIPVIAKADTLSPSDLLKFKERIRKVIAAQGIKVFTPPIDEDDRQAADHARDLTTAMPFAVIGSDKDVQTPEGKVVKGRQYLWGVAEVENEEHCDFKKLRSLLIRTHMLDLIQTTEDQHYEGIHLLALFLMQPTALNKWKLANLANPRLGNWTTPNSKRKKKLSGRDLPNKSNSKKLASDNGNREYELS